MQIEKIINLEHQNVLKNVDTLVAGLADESPGEGTNIFVATWASNGPSLNQQNPEFKDVNVFGPFLGVSTDEFLIERGDQKIGVSSMAPQGTHLAEDSIPTCPDGVSGSLNSHGKRIWSQTVTGHGVINLGVVVLNVGYTGGGTNEDELSDRLNDMAMDAHEDVYNEFSALTSDLDKLAYQTSGNAADTWIAGFLERVSLELAASDRGEWSPPAVSFVHWVQSVADFRVVLPTANHTISLLALESVPAPGSGYGYRNYSGILVPLTDGDSAIGQEFFLESESGRIGMRVLGCDFHSGNCGIWFTYYDVDLTHVQIAQPCAYATVAEESGAGMKSVRAVQQFRDQYLKALPRGRMYADLYRANTFQMWRHVVANRDIRDQAMALMPKVTQLVKTWRDPEPARLDQDTIASIKQLAELARKRASAQLQHAMDQVLPDLDHFQDLSLGQILLVLKEMDFPTDNERENK